MDADFGGAMDGRRDGPEPFGERLRAARRSAGMSQEELAERTGLSVRAIRNLERGRTDRPYPHTMRVLTDALRMTVRTTGPDPAAPDPAAPDPAPRPPRQLPAGTRHFVGRARELRRLTELLDEAATGEGTAVSVLDGMAGVGKTALAVHWAHQVADRFPGGQLYVNLRGFDPTGPSLTPARAIRQFLDALDVPAPRVPADLDAQTALYRTLVADRRMLLVLDNARNAGQVRPLLPGSPGCLALVTSRNQLTPLIATEDAQPITLYPLTRDEAWELLASRLGPVRVAAEPKAVAAVIDNCARLPLALTVVAARAAIRPDRPLAILAGELAETETGARAGLDALSAGDSTTDVRTVFSWSYQALSPEAARLFRLLGVHRGPDTSAAAAASLAGLAPEKAGPLLAELVRANLAVEHRPGRYSVHDLLRTYAVDLADTRDPEAERLAAARRLLDHYLHTAHAAEELLYPAQEELVLDPPEPGTTPERPADKKAALAWFTAEHAVLIAAVTADQAGVGHSLDRRICRLSRMLRTFLYRQGHWHDWAEAGHAALAAARRLRDPREQGYAHRGLAQAYTSLSRFEEVDAHARQALRMFARAGDKVGQAHTHYTVAYLWEQRSDHHAALAHARQALELYQAAGHRFGRANALNAIGWIHTQLGDHHEAVAACRQALDLLADLGDVVGQAQTLDSLGFAHHHIGDQARAIVCFQRALALFRDLDDRYDEADTLVHLGDAHHAAGDAGAAADHWRQALTILAGLDHADAHKVRAKLRALDRSRRGVAG
jgi:tetratricopeptide (TPR) repeat protein/transcriptional regulator with XRE-family HTH domain